MKDDTAIPMQNDLQQAKRLVLDHYAALDAASPDALPEAMARHVAEDYLWRGYHPFHEQTSGDAVAALFWQPLRHALTALQRRQDVFIAGRNEIDGFQSVWVVSMGHLMGLHDHDWLGIRPTGKIAMLRYCEFNRVEDGRIVETAMFFDIPHLMMQAGLQPFAPQTGAPLVQPGPMTHDGLCLAPQDPEDGRQTLAAINRMISDIALWTGGRSEPLEDELRRTWHEDMAWWGPAGIGATYTIPRYALQHTGPFRTAFVERRYNGHLCRLAEGHYGGFFGWPNLTLQNRGGFMGMPATGQWADMRIIDIYRRAGDKLAENWIFIDLLHFWNQQGVDILARTTQIAR